MGGVFWQLVCAGDSSAAEFDSALSAVGRDSDGSGFGSALEQPTMTVPAIRKKPRPQFRFDTI
jgi:hypothetical protein